jgi:hypothetical protein
MTRARAGQTLSTHRVDSTTVSAKPRQPKETMTMIRRMPGAPDFAPHIDELLKLAHVTNTPDARNALDWHLCSAWGTNRLQNLRGKSGPPELFKQLERSIKKTQKLLRKLGMFPPTEDIEFDRLCYLEESTITVATQKGGMVPVAARDPPPLGSYPVFIPPGATMATINRQRVLDRLLRDLDWVKPKRKRGGQRNPTYQAVVAFAGHYFRQYSTAKLTTYPDGKFAPFCKRFYEIAIGAPPLDGYVLDTQIKAEVKNPQLGMKFKS